jgi:hypothetical protein
MTKFFCNQTKYGCDVCCDLNDHVKRPKEDAELCKPILCPHSKDKIPHWLVVGGKYESG